jgi:hypothetical protein
MGALVDLAAFRAKRKAAADVPIGSPPFVLEEPCAGCGARRVSIMVWRDLTGRGEPVPFPRIEPHFLCRGGHVVWQEITDAPIPVSQWTSVKGRFQRETDAC